MNEILLGIPAAAGLVTDRVITQAWLGLRRPRWKNEIQEDSEWWADFGAHYGNWDAVQQAEVQVDNNNEFADFPEIIALGRLTYLKGLAAAVSLATAALKYRSGDYFGAYTAVSIATPFLVGAICDGVRAGGGLDPVLVFNRELPILDKVKKLLFG